MRHGAAVVHGGTETLGLHLESRGGSLSPSADEMAVHVLFARALIATFRCAAPARCGAFADERRVVVGDAGGWCRRETNAHPVCGFRSGWWVLGFGVRASAGRVAANASSFPLFDPVRERESLKAANRPTLPEFLSRPPDACRPEAPGLPRYFYTERSGTSRRFRCTGAHCRAHGFSTCGMRRSRSTSG